MCRTEGKVKKEWLTWVNRFIVSNEVNGMIDKIFIQVIALLGRFRRVDMMIVFS